jgi:hypothetical protein
LKRLTRIAEQPPADQRAVLKLAHAMLDTRRRSALNILSGKKRKPGQVSPWSGFFLPRVNCRESRAAYVVKLGNKIFSQSRPSFLKQSSVTKQL